MSNKFTIKTFNYNANTSFNNSVVLKRTAIDNLFLNINRGSAWYSVSDLTDYITSIKFYPISYDLIDSNTPSNKQRYLSVNTFGDNRIDTVYDGTADTIKVEANSLYSNNNLMFVVASFQVPNYTDFTEFEPYTIRRLYLPFFGFVQLKTSELLDCNVCVLLGFDHLTGNARYIVATTEDFIPNNRPYFAQGVDVITKIVGVYDFTLGCEISISSNRAADNVRTIALGALSTAATAALAYASGGTSLAMSSTTTKGVETITNTSKTISPNTNRLRTSGVEQSVSTIDKTSVHDYSGNLKRQAIQEVFNYSIDTLNNFVMRPNSVTRSGDFSNLISTPYVCIVTERCNIVPIDENYKHLYGVPLGEVRQLSTLNGYTEISNIHLEGEGFKFATLEEMSMIENALSNGFIL